MRWTSNKHKGWYTYDVHFEGRKWGWRGWGGGSNAKMRCYRTWGEGGGLRMSECSICFIIENWICAMTRHLAEPNIKILLARNLPFWLWHQTVKPSFNNTIALFVGEIPLMIPLHCLSAKFNNRTCGQFEFDLTCFCFCFDFVRSHARCSCYSIVCLNFQVVQIKQVDCKMSTKMWIIINKRYFAIFCITAHTKVQSDEKAESEAKRSQRKGWQD